MIDLSRAYLPDGSATLGILTVDGQRFATLEPPWSDNRPFVSCIPEGEYTVKLRPSEVVRDSSSGRYQSGWQIMDVPGRTVIMAHVGNWTEDTDGCLLIGKDFWWTGKGPMVTNSQESFARFMEVMGQRSQWRIRIRCNKGG